MEIVYIWFTITISVFYFLHGSIVKKLKAVKAGRVEEAMQTWGVSGGESWNIPFPHTVKSFFTSEIFFQRIMPLYLLQI